MIPSKKYNLSRCYEIIDSNPNLLTHKWTFDILSLDQYDQFDLMDIYEALYCNKELEAQE
jgi:hypothetical protein